MKISQTQNENITKSQEKSQEKKRKAFTFQKRTNKIFLKMKQGNKNKFLISAIYETFKYFSQENLFYQVELKDFLDDTKRF